MNRTVLTLALIALIVPAVAGAQGRGRRSPDGAYGIPPGQLPPPGSCRVWYDGLPPGRQPRAMSCRDAEAIATRNPGARVIYGETSGRTRDPYQRTYPGRYPGQSGNSRYDTPGFHVGYKDGYDQGFEDARGSDPYNPTRQGRYRSADHNYNNKYGSKDEYRNAFREGFRAGYDTGYREVRGARVRSY